MDSNIEVSVETINMLTSRTKKILLNSQTEWSSFGSAKIHRCIFSSAHLPMYNYQLLAPYIILKTCLDPARGVYSSTGCRSIDCNVLKKPLLPPSALCNCCAILYFVRNPLSTPGHGSLCLHWAPVGYKQPSYATTIYLTMVPVLSSNRFKEWIPPTCFDELPCTCLRFSHGSVNSRKDRK